jgi:hypothetical protein
MNLNIVVKNLKSWAEAWPAKKTHDMTQVAKLAISHGWYLNEVFLFSLYRDYNQEIDFPVFMEQLILSEWDEHWNAVITVSPARKSILNEAKSCFEDGYYSAAIHMLFSQSDGIFYDKFEKSLFKKQGEVAKGKVAIYLNDFIAKDSLELLAAQYRDGSVLRRMSNEIYTAMFSVIAADAMKNIDPKENETSLIIPNRHGVLHGYHKDYGSKVNALKCFSMFLFVVWSIHGEDMMNTGT